MKKILAILLSLVLLSAVMTGCSGGKGFRTLDEIKASGKIVMLTNAEFQPFEYMKNNEIVGVDIVLGKMVADELGVELEIVNMNFDLLVEALKGHKGDFVAAGMTARPDRAEKVEFTNSYFDNGLLIIVKEGSSITSPEDLKGMKIAVQDGTTADVYVTESVENAEVMRFKAITEAGSAVASGKADAAVMDIVPAQGIVAKSNGSLALLEEQLTEEKMSMAVAKGNTELLEVINRVLDQAVKDGTVKALVEEHSAA